MDNNNLNNQNQPQQNLPQQDMPPQNEPQNDVSMIDKFKQNNPFVQFGQAQYENVQTQSVVKSTREEADEQLAAINAQNAEYLRQQKMAEEAAKAKRTGIYIAIFAFFAVIVGVAAWLIISAFIAGQKTYNPDELPPEEEEAKYGKVEGYKCTSEQCEKFTDINKDLILIRDAKKFYVFNKTDKTKTLTTIPTDEYHAITPFKWGDNYLAILDPESSQSALYNITANRQITEFSYDEFFTNVSDALYKDMTWVENKCSYIVARSGSSKRLIDLSSGAEMVRGSNKVFTNSGYFFGFESDGTIHIYSESQSKIVMAKSDENVFTKNQYLIILNKSNSPTIYDSTGKKVSGTDIQKTITAIQSKKRLDALLADKSFYHVVENN